MRFASLAAVAALAGAGAPAQLLPRITLTPPIAAAGSGDLTLTVSGTQFKSNLQVLWNGSPLATAFMDADTLKATIPAGDLANPGLFSVSLAASDSEMAASESTPFMVYVALRANDLIYDTARSVIYLSVSAQDPNGPSIGILQPGTGTVNRYITLPGEPGALAISADSHYLYVALSDRVRRIDLTTRADYLDLMLSTLPEWGREPASAILPLDQAGSTVAVSMSRSSGSGMVIFDGAQPRPGYTIAGSSCLPGTSDGTTIYGEANQDLLIYKLTPTGVSGPQSQTLRLFGGFSCPVYAAGLIYDGAGNIVDASAPAITGHFEAWGLVRPVPEANRIYAIGSTPYAPPDGPIYLMTFELATGRQLGSLTLPVTMQTLTTRLIAWGSGGLAFADSPGAQGGPSARVYVFEAPAN